MFGAIIPNSLKTSLRGPLDRFIVKRMRPAASIQQLESRSIYIIPTSQGLLFACVLYVMLLGSINYGNSMGFMLTFLLSGVAMVGMLYTFRNLSSLQLSAGRPKPVFAGDMAEFPLFAQTQTGRSAYRVAVGLDRRNVIAVDIDRNAVAELRIPVQTRQRGYHKLERLRVQTTFPLGWFHAWSWLALKSKVLVYPKPAGHRHLPKSVSLGDGHRQSQTQGNEDFAGMRRYQPSDPPAHIAWKALARGHEVLTKQFCDESGDEIWLDWDALPDLQVEARLSQLTQWVLQLHQQGHRYGLHLPNITIEPGDGEQHRLDCLEALALYE